MGQEHHPAHHSQHKQAEPGKAALFSTKSMGGSPFSPEVAQASDKSNTRQKHRANPFNFSKHKKRESAIQGCPQAHVSTCPPASSTMS
jgi:hypothetical protein